MQPVVILLIAGSAMFIMIGGLSLLSHYYTLNGIKSRTVGDGQYGTARFATQKEIAETYESIPYEPERWRKGEHLPMAQGMILGSMEKAGKLYALVDTGDVHCLMIGAAGVGKTAHFLYPNIEYACASGMSFLTTDTKGDLYRNYAGIAQKYYGYQTAVIDLRNPTRSDGDNMLHLVNKYMDVYLADPTNLGAKAKAEKYAKITAKTIISSQGADSSSYGQNAFFYDAAEGILTAAILLIAEFCPEGKRHIISVFIVNVCNKHNKTVLCATDILLSHTNLYIPSRSDIMDISHIISKGCKGIVLNNVNWDYEKTVCYINKIEQRYS